MKRLLGGLLTISLALTALVLPTPVLAQQAGHVAKGVVAWAPIGMVVTRPLPARVFVPGQAVAVFPAPVWVFGPVHYPAATCWDFWVNGFWLQGTWVASHWERVCR